MNQFRLPPITAPLLPLLGALFFVGVGNVTFWSHFSSAARSAGDGGLLIHLGMFLMLVAAFNACLALINYRYVLKPVLILLLLVSAATGYFMDQYGTAIDWLMIQNVADTDVRESAELLNWKLLLRLTLMGVLPSVLVAKAVVRYPSRLRQFWWNNSIVLGSLAIAALILMLTFKSLAPALHEHRELRFMLMPTNYIQAVHSYLKRAWATPVHVAPLGMDARKGALWPGAQRRTITVIVVGETARAANFSLNGYARITNPQLAQREGLLNFTRMTSCGTATAVSVPCLFSTLGRENFSDNRATRQEGLLDVLSHAGLQVLWRDNNSGCKGVCDRVKYEDLSHPRAGDTLCSSTECFDEILLRGLPEMIAGAKQDMVIVLHQKGSHGPAYSERHPASFTKFGPECGTNELATCSSQSIVNAYDNTILYTDYFLDRVIGTLNAAAEKDNVDTAFMYFSDHGESLGENNMYLHGAPYMIAPSEQTHVPFMLWLSEGFRQRFRLDQACLSARRDQQFSHDNIFHSVLGMLNISTAIYNPRLDLFSACANARP